MAFYLYIYPLFDKQYASLRNASVNGRPLILYAELRYAAATSCKRIPLAEHRKLIFCIFRLYLNRLE